MKQTVKAARAVKGTKVTKVTKVTKASPTAGLEPLPEVMIEALVRDALLEDLHLVVGVAGPDVDVALLVGGDAAGGLHALEDFGEGVGLGIDREHAAAACERSGSAV